MARAGRGNPGTSRHEATGRSRHEDGSASFWRGRWRWPRPAGWRRAGAEPGRGPVTNLPLPRFVSMRAESANARRGPSLDQRVDWEFVRRGLPLEVVAEYGQWRRVRDAEGYGGWVHHTLLSGVRTALVRGEAPVPLRAGPTEGAAVRAMAEPGVVGAAGGLPRAAGARSTPGGSRAGCRGRRSGGWGRRRSWRTERGGSTGFAGVARVNGGSLDAHIMHNACTRHAAVVALARKVKAGSPSVPQAAVAAPVGGNPRGRRARARVRFPADGLDAPRKLARGSCARGQPIRSESDARRHRGPDDPARRLCAAGLPRRRASS